MVDRDFELDVFHCLRDVPLLGKSLGELPAGRQRHEVVEHIGLRAVTAAPSDAPAPRNGITSAERSPCG